MLEINMDDVIAVVQSIQTELIAFTVFLVLAIVVTVAVNRRTVRNTAARKLTHSTSGGGRRGRRRIHHHDADRPVEQYDHDGHRHQT